MATYDKIGWDTLQRRFVWRQGEHLITVAPTGGGKTTLLSRLLPRRNFVVVLVTKTFDPTFGKEFRGYHRIEKWPPPSYRDRVLLWPKPGKSIRETIAIQKRVFREALDSIFMQRGWTIVVDEEHYCCTTLGLEPEIAMLLHQGRSSGLTLVNGTQRPAWVPVVTYSSASHGFVWKTTDETDMKRLANLGGIQSKELRENLLTLDKHEFIYVPTRNGRDPVRSQVEV